MSRHISACAHDCPSVCSLEVERLDDHHIGRVHGAKGNTYTAGVICAKVARYAERVHHPDRLTEPLVRRGAKGEGRFEPIFWDAALDKVAEAFTRATQAHGAEAVWPFHSGGTMGLIQRYGMERLRNVMGYSGEHATVCITPAWAGWRAGVGNVMGPDPREIGEADLIIAWGTNIVSTQVNVMTHVARARRERRAKLAVVDVYRTPTVEAADISLIIRPGTDGALACALMHVILAEGLADREYLGRYSDFDESVEKHLAGKTPAWAARITGLKEDAIIDFARLYATTKRSFIRVGIGFSRSRNGAANMHAVTCLPTVTGAWRRQSGGAFLANSALWDLDRDLVRGLSAAKKGVRVLDQSRIGAILTGDREALRGGPPVSAMLLQNSNCAVTAPDTSAVLAGLAREDLFVCVHEQFMTPTARLADIVLPATTFMEHDDVYVGFGQTHLALAPKVIEPYAQSRPNHEVVCGIARRVGAEHPGFDMTAWELIDAMLRASKLPDVETVRTTGWLDGYPGFDKSHFIDGFPNKTGRFRFKPDWQAIGPYYESMPAFPDHAVLINEASDEHPFRMVTPPARSFLNSSFTETPTSRRREGRPTLLIHPADAEAIGIADGEKVLVGNRRGSIRLPARFFDGIQQGVVLVEGVWPNQDFEDGVGINLLTDPRPIPPEGGAAFHDNAVWVRRIA